MQALRALDPTGRAPLKQPSGPGLRPVASQIHHPVARRPDHVAQLGERCPLGLIKSAEVLVYLSLGHSGILNVGAERVKVAETSLALIDSDSAQSRSGLSGYDGVAGRERSAGFSVASERRAPSCQGTPGPGR